MSGSRSRQKRKPEPISLEELAGATGMSGFCSFLTRDAQIPVPALDHLERGAPDTAAPDHSAVEIHAVEIDAPDIGAPVEAAPPEPASETAAPESPALVSRYGDESGAPDPPAPTTGAEQTAAVYFRFQRRPRIREAHTVQDGHSLAEQAVYETMYGAGKPYREESRILTVGLRTLAELSRMAYSNCKANVRSLIAKKALDELPGFSYIDGRTYIIYSPAEIMRRRREAGLTYVLRTRGVAFVDPQSGAPQTSAPDASAVNATAIPNLESSAPESILLALRRQDPAADEAAAAVLWRRCREVEPSATPEEVVQFIHLKGGQPIGFLLSAVPRCFQGAAFRQFREWARSVLPR